MIWNQIPDQSYNYLNPIQNRFSSAELGGHPDEIRAPARVIEIMRDRAYRVELPNGHRCVGQAEKDQTPLAEGVTVTIAFHPYDLSRGWIVMGSDAAPSTFPLPSS